MTAVKGLDFDKAYVSAQKIRIDNVEVLFLDLQSLITAKMASGRYKDKDDLEHLTVKK